MIAISPMKIIGDWIYGYALDYHTLSSDYIGGEEFGHPQYDNTRSDMGDLVYNLKYKMDKSVIPAISETVSIFIKEQRWMPEVLIPVPPSCLSRSFQPVFEVAEYISHSLEIDMYSGCIEKVKETPELKNVDKYKERKKLLDDAFTITDKSLVEGKRILLFDDLYRSGATLKSIARVLNQQGNVKEIYALTLTKTRRKK
ncbi:ComF family protein [Candidatus Latescibacterota bacterium]